MSAETMRLGDMANWSSGSTPRASESTYYGGSIPWVTITDMTSREVSSSSKQLTDEGLASIGGSLAPAGAVLCSMYGTIGKAAVVSSPVATNQAIAVGVPDRSVTTPEFLYYTVVSKREELDALGRGATQRNINRSQLESMRVLVPSLAEQRRIVDLLASADRVVDAAGAEVDAAEYARAQLVDGFLAAVQHRAPIGSVLEARTGTVTVSDAVLYTQVTVSGKGRGMRLREQKYGKDIGTKKQRVISADDLIVSKLGASDGACCVVPAEFAGAIVTQDFPTFAVRKDAALPGYLDIVVRTSQFAHQCASITTGTGQGRVNMGRFGELPIPLPDLAGQKALVEIAAVAAARIESAKVRLEAARHLRDQLLHDLLSGSRTIPDSYDQMLDKEGE